MPEIIRHGRTGFLVGDTDAAVAAVSQLGDIDRAHCRADVESRFTSQRMANDYIRVYEKIISRKEA